MIKGKDGKTPKQATDTTKAENGKPTVSLLELGWDGEVSPAVKAVILTTQTRCLMTGRNTTHTGSQCPKKQHCHYLPKLEMTKLITAIRKEEGWDAVWARSSRKVKRQESSI